jgi:hypothetical protein
MPLPHVDQVLCERNGLGVARDGDGAVRVAAGLSVLAVGDSDHGTAQLSEKR